MLWLLCGVSHTQSVAYAYDRTSSSASWGYQPLRSIAPSGTSAKPTYTFHTTSAYINCSKKSDYRMIINNNPLLSSGSGDDDDFPGFGDDDLPIGDLSEEELPLGEPLVLLAFALVYLGLRVRKNLGKVSVRFAKCKDGKAGAPESFHRLEAAAHRLSGCDQVIHN